MAEFTAVSDKLASQFYPLPAAAGCGELGRCPVPELSTSPSKAWETHRLLTMEEGGEKQPAPKAAQNCTLPCWGRGEEYWGGEGCSTWTVSVSISPGRPDSPLGWWLVNNRYSFPTVLEAGSLRSECQGGRVLRALFQAADRCLFPHCPHRAEGEGGAEGLPGVH